MLKVNQKVDEKIRVRLQEAKERLKIVKKNEEKGKGKLVEESSSEK